MSAGARLALPLRQNQYLRQYTSFGWRKFFSGAVSIKKQPSFFRDARSLLRQAGIQKTGVFHFRPKLR
jgi:hypothetical protein